MPIPSVKIYIRRHATRQYKRMRTRNPQPLQPGDVYVLHVWYDGKRKWITVGTDITVALRREMEEQVKLISVQKTAEVATPEPLRVNDAVRGYLNKVSALKSERTSDGYSYVLKEFRKVCQKEFVKDINRRDLENFVVAMKEQKLGDRTIYNRVCEVVTFLRAHDIYNVKLIHKYTEKVVKAYTTAELERLFAAADQEESDLFLFFLGSGGREQEVQHACWSDINFEEGIFTVHDHPEFDWKPKDREEREIKLADNVVEMLRARRERSTTELIFSNTEGRPDGHMLRTLKALAKRAGVVGAGLHKFRKSYATILHRNGVPARTIQARLGHSDLATTLSYLEVEDVRSEAHETAVNNAFGAFGQAAVSVQ